MVIMAHLKVFRGPRLVRPIQYLVIATDFPNALDRRLQQRQQHLDRAKLAKEQGLILLGGATFSENNEMNGSMLLFDAHSREEVESYLVSDPYVSGKVWEKWSIQPFRCAAVSKKLFEGK
jgi:uncharacterized protein YciI